MVTLAASTGLVLVLGTITALAGTSIVDTADASSDQRYHAIDIVTHLRAMDGLEWRAAAGEDVAEIGKAFEAEAAHLLDEFDAHPNLAPLRAPVLRYTDAVRDELAAIAAGDRDAAERIDEDRVDPSFEVVIDSAEDLADDAARTEDLTSRRARVFVWIGAFILVALLAGSILAMNATRVRARRRQIADAASRRFRSLVESSSDVIMTINGRGALAIESPHLGELATVAREGSPFDLHDVLGDAGYAEWTDRDEIVRRTGKPQQLDVDLSRRDGTPVSFELSGAKLAGDPDTTVWTWHDVTERRELQRQLSHQAFHDDLTGLPNRFLLHDRIEQALVRRAERDETVTIVFCDLDNFKSVNDTLGHAAGDELLVAVAERLAGCLRPGDSLARFGGDEFVAVLVGGNPDHAVATARDMLASLSVAVRIRERTFVPTISIGLVHAENSDTVEQLLRHADIALYAAKRAGKSTIEVFDAALHAADAKQLDENADLARALRDGEFVLHYQPIIDMASREVTAVEALVRWNHPVRGMTGPDAFIPQSDRSGFIVPLGKWVLREACAAAVGLNAAACRKIAVHVNVAPRQLHDAQFVAETAAALAESGLPAELLVVEVTESGMLDDRDAIARLAELRGMGISVAIDDFGTGYTSIRSLRHLPIDVLKIDRSFVSGNVSSDDERRAFLDAIMTLAATIGLRTVAEGVETEAQVDEMVEIGCHEAQGYFWARPMPLDDATYLLTAAGRAPSTHATVLL